MPQFKSVSFPGAPHPVALKFGDDDPLFADVAPLSSARVRGMIGCESYEELLDGARRAELSPHKFIHEKLERALGREERRRAYTGWPAGALAKGAAAREIVRESKTRAALDPFAGRAAYVVAAAQVASVRALYCELSPVYRFVAQSRIEALLCTPAAREEIAAELEEFAPKCERKARGAAPDAMLTATRPRRFEEAEEAAEVAEAIEFLARLRSAVDELRPLSAAIAHAAVIEALPRATAGLSRREFVRDFRAQVEAAAKFLRNEETLRAPVARIADDARDLSMIEPLGIGCVVTNPPSLNFASYTQPVALWFLGLRRQRSRRQRDPAEALAHVRLVLGDDGKRAAAEIAADVKKLERESERMARVAANYFADMCDAAAAISSHMTDRATFAFEVAGSSLAGVEIGTPEHLLGILGAFGFGYPREAEPFRVVSRQA